MEQRKAPGRSVMFAVEPRPDAVTGEPADLPYNYYYMDPVTAEIVGARNWGACCFEPENLMNFTYELHRTLMLPGLWGLYITGAVAVIWLLASLGFVGYAAASSRFPNARKIPFIAVGVLMIPLAVSNVAMNLNDELFRPVVNWFSPIKPTIYGEYAAMESPDYGERKLTYRDAFDQATAFGREKGWSNPPGEFFYSAIYNFYGVGYGLRDPHNMGNDWIFISADNGAVLRERTPRSGTAGEVFAAAQLPIHSGRVLGGLSQFYVFVMGLLITFLCWRLGRFAVRGLSNS
jgi:uncharacterized iron-regulated membrane protein